MKLRPDGKALAHGFRIVVSLRGAWERRQWLDCRPESYLPTMASKHNVSVRARLRWFGLVLSAWLLAGPAAAQAQPAGGAATNAAASSSPTVMTSAWDKSVSALHRIIDYPLVTLGDGSVTLAAILKMLLLFALVLVAEFILRRFFTRRVLKRTPFDPPMQYAIARISGYVFIVVGFYVVLATMHVPLGSLAVVAGAVGVGVGFGLQNIVHNFISGIIILAERPIALGDRVEVGGVAGTVSKIRLRSTEIVTNDNISIIVPNSDFITNPVTNWSHGDPRVQIRIPVGVAYGTDVEKLKTVLLQVAAENSNVLKSPKTTVYFDGFGDSALQFELGVWTEAMTHSPRRFRSELNFAIERKLREHRIEIPFPQRDLHLKSGAFVLPSSPPSKSAAE